MFWPIAGVAGCILLRATLEYIREAVGNHTAGEIKLNLREYLYQHVLALGPGYFDQRRTGEVVMSLVEGVEQLETFFGQYFPQLAVAALTPILIFVFMAAFDVQTAYVFLAFALFTLILPLLTTNGPVRAACSGAKPTAPSGPSFWMPFRAWPPSKPSARVAPMARCWPSARAISIAARWECWRPTSPPLA